MGKIVKPAQKSLIEVYKTFGTTDACLAYLEAARWPQGVVCPVCGCKDISKFVTNETTRELCDDQGNVVKESRVPSRTLYNCKEETCRFQFSATAGTIFDKSHLPLPVWFQAVALIVNAKKSIAARQMARDLGVSVRTAWFLNHRIREAMQSEEGLFGGTVEVDATFHGGVYDPRRQRAIYDKQPVAGVLQRKGEGGHSKVKAFLVPKEIGAVMTGVIRDNVSTDAEVMTDDHGAYKGLSKIGYQHDIVAHSREEWVRGRCHTQGIESFWSLFKRGVIGSFHQVTVRHLHRYLNEFSFRFNNRESEDLFGLIILNLVMGQALRYKALTAKPSFEQIVAEHEQ